METIVIPKKRLNNYYKKIQKSLLCKRKIRKKIIYDFKCNVEVYIEENPKVTFSEIVEHFGTPEKIAEEFAVNMGINYNKQLRRKKFFSSVIICLLILIMIFTAAVMIMILHNYNRDAAYYYDVSLINGAIENGES